MQKSYRDICIIILATLILTLLVWLPHLLSLHNFYNLDFSAGFNTVYRNFDGLEYIIVAKSFYDPNIIATMPQSLPDIYYSSRFPLYPIIILIFSPFLGFLKSMLFVTLISTIASAIAFYFLIKDFKLTSSPLTLSLIFLVLPARWLIVHTVGSVEPTFILFTILTFYFFLKFEHNKRWLYIIFAGIFGLLAQLTRSPGILIFISLGLYITWKLYRQKNIKSIFDYLPLILIPVGLISVFYVHLLAYQDFFAYFHSGDNIHLTFPPFQVFNKNQTWVGDIWLEDIIYIFLLTFSGAMLLIKQKLYPLAFFVFTFLTASILVAHRDISRYTLPLFPFLLIAFENLLVSKPFKVVLAILILAIYLYAQNFIISNIAPFPNLEAFN